MLWNDNGFCKLKRNLCDVGLTGLGDSGQGAEVCTSKEVQGGQSRQSLQSNPMGDVDGSIGSDEGRASVLLV